MGFKKIITSGYQAVDSNKNYTFTYYDNLISASGIGEFRLNCYTAGLLATSPAFLSISLSGARTVTGWNRVVNRVYAFNRNSGLAAGLMWPSGTANVKVELIQDVAAGTATERYINGVDLSEGFDYMGFTPSTNDGVIVTYKELSNGVLNTIYPVLRTDYEHILDRKWTAADTAYRPYISFDDIGVKVGESYVYAIDAYDTNGNQSSLSSVQEIVAGDVFPPAHVSGIYLEATPGGLLTTWTSPADKDFSYVNIYSDISLTNLLWREFGVPGETDQAWIGGLPVSQHVLYYTTVDKYGNENRTNPPTATGTPLSTEGQGDITTNIVGDQFVTAEYVKVFIYSKYPISGVPTAYVKLANGAQIDVSGVNYLNSSGNAYLFSGGFTVTTAHSEGRALLHASGVPSGITVDLINIPEIFFIDRSAPSVGTISVANAAYINGSNYYYRADTPVRVQYTLTDPNIVGDSGSGPKNGIFRWPLTNSEGVTRPYVPNVTNQVDLNISDQPDGQVNVYIQGEDVAGNVSTPPTLVPNTIVLDKTPPIVSIRNSNIWFNTSTVNIPFDADDGGVAPRSGFSGVRYQYKYGSGGAWSSWASTTAGVTNPMIQFNSVTDDIYLRYYGVDYAGNPVNPTPDSTIIRTDIIAPTVAVDVFKVAECKPIAGGFQLVWDNTKITDNRGVESIKIWRTESSTWSAGSASGVVTIPFASGTTTQMYNDTTSSLKYNQSYWWWIQAKDYANNYSTVSNQSIGGQIGHDVKGIFRNRVGNGSFERTDNSDVNKPDSWRKVGSPTIVASTYALGSKSARVNNANYYVADKFQWLSQAATKRWVFSLYARKDINNCTLRIELTGYDANWTLTTYNYDISLTSASWNRFSFTIGNTGNINIPSSILSFDMKISTLAGDFAYIDGVQLEEGTTNTQTAPTEYVDSYVLNVDVLQGQLILGSMIETDTLTARNAKFGIHGGNKLFNSSFELMSGTGVVDRLNWDRAGGTLYFNNGGAHGDHFAYLLNTGDSVTSKDYIVTNTGNTHTVSFYYLNSNAITIGLALLCYNSSKTLLGAASQFVSTTSSPTSWTRAYSVFDPVLFPVNTYYTKLVVQKAAGVGPIQIDAVQYEEGGEPTNFDLGGFTEINGRTITTGKIQSKDSGDGTINYLDLDVGEFKSISSNADGNKYTLIRAGSVLTSESSGSTNYIAVLASGQLLCKDNTTGTYTQVSRGNIKNYNGVTGDYSVLSEGSLKFWNQTAGVLTNYANQVTVIPASQVNCGTAYTFATPYPSNGPAPWVIMAPACIMTFFAGNTAFNSYIGFDTEGVTTTGFTPRAYYYTGGTSPTVVTVTTPNRATALFEASSTYTLTANDAYDENKGGTSVNKVVVTVRGRNKTATNKVTLGCTVRVRTGGTTWNTGTDQMALSANVVTGQLDSDWYYDTITFNLATSAQKHVKLDWSSGGATATHEVELYKIDYIVMPTRVELTGSGLAHCLVIGRTQ